MATLQQGLHLGTKRVYTINPNSAEPNTAYKGSEFDGNAIYFADECMVSINGTEGIQALEGTTIYIANNYYYQFHKEVLLSQLIITAPDLGVTQTETSLVDVALIADTESATLISMTLDTGMEMPAGKGTFEVSFIVQNTTNQNATLVVRVYDDAVLVGEDTGIAVGKNEVYNYFNSGSNSTPVSAGSVITVTAELTKDGNVLAPIDLSCRVGN